MISIIIIIIITPPAILAITITHISTFTASNTFNGHVVAALYCAARNHYGFRLVILDKQHTCIQRHARKHVGDGNSGYRT
jgi:hypothetical protein